MVWYAYREEFQPLIRYELPDGRVFILQRKTTLSRGTKINSLCKLFSLIGDVTTAGRRRSWFFEGLYSKTRIGFIGYCLIKDLLIDGRHKRSTYIQHRVPNCHIWQHRDWRDPVDYRYEF